MLFGLLSGYCEKQKLLGNYENESSTFDIDNFIPTNESDEDSSNFSDESNTLTNNKRKLAKNASSSHPKHSPVFSTTNPLTGNKGRKRHLIWASYLTTFAENGKILSNDCKCVKIIKISQEKVNLLL
jgi:hypothetical protein